MPNNWIVHNRGIITYIASSKENAQVMCDFLNRNGAAKLPRNLNFEVREYYTDNNLTKIKQDCKLWDVVSKKDGTIVSVNLSSFSAPNAYAFYRKSIIPLSHTFVTAPDDNVKELVLVSRHLAKTEEEAITLAEKLRLKSLLDDAWNPQLNRFTKGYLNPK